jgi:phosphoglycolate phosphatase-like HAD superfamily hydrolase
VVCSTGELTAMITLKHTGLEAYFEHIEGDCWSCDTRILGLHNAMGVLGLQAPGVCYIGAVPSVLEAAAVAGITPLAAAWAPSCDPSALRAAHPHEIFFTVDRFVGWLTKTHMR